VFYDYDRLSKHDKMFHCWFNTGFLGNDGRGGGYLLLHKAVLDRACKDKACKEFEEGFKLELFFDRSEDSGSVEELGASGVYLGDDADVDEDEGVEEAS
jgi:hypothetical protein